jgi:hypothetical protein
MILSRRATALVTALAGLACSSPLDLPRALLGQWVSAPADLRPQGWHQYHLTFHPTGSYASEVRTYGLNAGQPATQLSAFSREEGRFRTEGDRLVMEAHRLVVWDRFYGSDSPEQVHEPYPYGTAPLHGARFEVLGDRLILHYTTYPADAPVATTKEYRFAQ